MTLKEKAKCTCKEHDPYCCQIHGSCPTCIKKEEPKQDRTCTHNCSVVCGECQIFEPKQELERGITITHKQETLEEAFEKWSRTQASYDKIDVLKFGAKWNQEQILQFLYSEITERRPYSSSKMCEVVIEFIEQLNTKK